MMHHPIHYVVLQPHINATWFIHTFIHENNIKFVREKTSRHEMK